MTSIKLSQFSYAPKNLLVDSGLTLSIKFMFFQGIPENY